MLHYWLEDGGRGHKPRNASGLYKLEKPREQLLQGLQKKHRSATPCF
jgi:hypothetical protein